MALIDTGPSLFDEQTSKKSLQKTLNVITKDGIVDGKDSKALEALASGKEKISDTSKRAITSMLHTTLKKGFSVRNEADKTTLDHVLTLAGFPNDILKNIPDAIIKSPEGYITKLNSESVTGKGSTGQQLFVYQINDSIRDNDVAGYVDKETGKWNNFTWNIYTRDDNMVGNNTLQDIQLGQDEDIREKIVMQDIKFPPQVSLKAGPKAYAEGGKIGGDSHTMTDAGDESQAESSMLQTELEKLSNPQLEDIIDLTNPQTSKREIAAYNVFLARFKDGSISSHEINNTPLKNFLLFLQHDLTPKGISDKFPDINPFKKMETDLELRLVSYPVEKLVNILFLKDPVVLTAINAKLGEESLSEQELQAIIESNFQAGIDVLEYRINKKLPKISIPILEESFQYLTPEEHSTNNGDPEGIKPNYEYTMDGGNFENTIPPTVEPMALINSRDIRTIPPTVEPMALIDNRDIRTTPPTLPSIGSTPKNLGKGNLKDIVDKAPIAIQGESNEQDPQTIKDAFDKEIKLFSQVLRNVGNEHAYGDIVYQISNLKDRVFQFNESSESIKVGKPKIANLMKAIEKKGYELGIISEEGTSPVTYVAPARAEEEAEVKEPIQEESSENKQAPNRGDVTEREHEAWLPSYEYSHSDNPFRGEIPTLDSIKGNHEAEQAFFRKFGLVSMDYKDIKTDTDGIPYYATSVLSEGNRGATKDVHMNLAGKILQANGSIVQAKELEATPVVPAIPSGEELGGTPPIGRDMAKKGTSDSIKESKSSGVESTENILVVIMNYLNLKGSAQKAVSKLEGINPREISKEQMLNFFTALPADFVLSSEASKTPEGKQVAFMLQSTIALLMPDNEMGAIDGLWGAKSKAALKKVQTEILGMDPKDADSKKRPDGVFGPNTREALIAKLQGENIQETVSFQTRYEIYKTRAENLTGAERGLLDLIASGEAKSTQGYETYYSLGLKPSKKFSEMTIAEVFDYQKKSLNYQYDQVSKGLQDKETVSSPTGRYQILNKTLKGLVEQYGIDINTKFDSTTQDMLAIMLLEEKGMTQKYINGSMSDKVFIGKVAEIWAAVPRHTGKSNYAGVGNNKARIAYADMLRAAKALKA